MGASNLRRSAALLAAAMLLASCGGSPQETAAMRPQSAALSPQGAATPSSTRSYVNGVFIETGLDTVPGQVYRLYQAAFDRVADPGGLGYQVGVIEVFGHPLVEVAANFVASPEFVNTYGALSNQDFVTLLYNNVLHRAPDSGGLQYWQAQLLNGSTRAQVLLGFSESPENKAQTAPAVSAGITFDAYPATRVYLTDGTYVETNPDGTAGQVYRLYQAAFNRTPDAAGLGYQIGSIESVGVSFAQVAQNFISSAEFTSKYGSLDDTQFVTQLYANVLHRAPDPGGLQYWTNLLATGTSRAAVLIGFSESPENKANTAPAISVGMHFVPYPYLPSTPPIDPLAPLPPFGFDQTIALLGVLPDGQGGDSGGDGGAAGAAGDGAPIANATVVLTDSLGNTVNGLTDSNGNYLLRFKTSQFVAPYVVKVVDAGGSVLASATVEQAGTGKFIYVNVNPLTDKVTSDTLDSSIGGTDKSFTGAAIDASKLSVAKQNLITSIAGALGTAGVSNLSTFDPVQTPYKQNGTGVDTVVDSVSHTRDPVTGQTVLQAKLAPLQTDANGVPIPVVISAASPLSPTLVATVDSASLTYTKLNAWTSLVNYCLSLPPGTTDSDPKCNKGLPAVSKSFLNNGKSFDEDFRLLFSDSDDGTRFTDHPVSGSTVRNPVVLFTGSYAGSSINDLAVVEITVRQPRTGNLAGNVNQPIEYTKQVVFKRDDTLVGAAAGNWIAYGNQRNFDISMATRYVRSAEMNPARQGNTSTGVADSYQTRLNFSITTSVYNTASETYSDSNISSVRVTGPGLPASGIVLVRSSAVGANYLAIYNKTGVIPPPNTFTLATANSFGLAAVASDGSALAGTGAFNPNAVSNSTSAPDFSQLGAYGRYKFEVYFTTNTTLSAPDDVEYAHNLADAQPPATAISFPYNDVTPSASLDIAPQPSSQGELVHWSNNLNAGPVYQAQVNAQERNPKGATAGFTTNSWDVEASVYAAYSLQSRPTSQTVLSPSTPFPSLTTSSGDFRQIAIWSRQSRALVQNLLRWDN